MGSGGRSFGGVVFVGLAYVGLTFVRLAEARHAGEMADEVDADAGFLGSAGSGRDDDAVGMKSLDFSDGDFVIAADFDLCA